MSTTQRSSQKCGDAFETVVTTTTKTDFVLDEATRTWSLGKPVVSNTSTHARVAATACPPKVKPAVAASAVLPNTGGPSLVLGFLGALMLLCGFALVRSQRTVAVSSGMPLVSNIRRSARHQRTGDGTWIVRKALPVLRRNHRDVPGNDSRR